MSKVDSNEPSVSIGPDLNESRPPLDKKLYRQILLPNGMRAVLVSDTVAMHQFHARGGYFSDDSEEEDSQDDESETSSQEDDDDDDAGDGLREAAAALLVGVGSMYDPPEAQGLAHFLEHMLFMGTKKYPEENAFSAFISKIGGSDNAFTEYEHTVFHMEIPQESLFSALDMFAQFFIQPLLLEDAVERELNAVESEFQLVKNSDSSRVQQLQCHTNGKSIEEHPFGKFSWGNLKSLLDAPKQHGKDLMKELWTFYHQFYYAQNMKLVVVGAYSLDKLQEKVLELFSDIPALPREPSTLQAKHVNPNSWEGTYESKMATAGMPLAPSSLQTIFRIAPVQDRETLSITWQVPSQNQNWRSKPCDYIAHLIGHEAQGSILSSLKAKSWAFGCYAGVGDDGMENASSHGLFIVSFTLSEEGVSHWPEVISEVYRYIGMLRHYCNSPEGLPEWIYEELRNIHEVAYHYGDEPSSEDLAVELAEELAPSNPLPPERLLDGSALLFEYDPIAVKELLDEYLTPQNARIDLLSSTFGRAADFEAEENAVSPVSSDVPVVDSKPFKASEAGTPEIEPMFGTPFWRRQLIDAQIASWSEAFAAALPGPDSLLSLPPKNPFVPDCYALKPLPPDDDDHPLVHSSLKLCVTIGKKKSWFPATVTKYNGIKNQLLLSYEDEDEKWHGVDQDVAHFSSATLSPGYEGTLDQKAIKYRIVSVATSGKGPQLKYGDGSDHHVNEGAQFPPIPPALPASRLPQLVCNTQVLKLWHMQDRTYKRPIAEFRVNIVCEEANKSPLYRACADLLVQLCHDAVVETSYLASVCELGSSIEAGDIGFGIRVYGFDDKLLDLFEFLFGVFLSFRGRETLPETINPERFEACLELQMRSYSNAGMRASRFCSSGRIRCLRPTSWSPHSKSTALKGIDVPTFCATVTKLLSRFGMEVLYYGNVDRSDADTARDLLLKMVNSSGNSAGLSRKKYPLELVTKLPHSKTRHDVVLPSRDPTEPNSAVEVYFQIGKDNLVERVIIDLIAHLMDEPLYDQIRTKDQFGYDVSCDSRWTCGVMGMYFRIVSSVKSATEMVDRIEKFLVDYFQELKKMTPAEFLVEVVGLANIKLEMHESLADACGSLWGEIRDGRYIWQVEREEVLCLRNITKDQVLEAYEEWFLPTKDGKANKRRMLTIQVIGCGEGAVSAGRPDVDDSMVGQYADECIDMFYKTVGKQVWGRIY